VAGLHPGLLVGFKGVAWRQGGEKEGEEEKGEERGGDGYHRGG